MRRLLAATALLLLLAGCGVRSRQLPLPETPPPTQSAPVEPSGGAETKPTTGPAVGLRAPSIAGVNVITGQQVSLGGFRGQTVMLNFWATWCLPCRAEMPIMQKLSQEMAGKLHVVAVGYSDFETTKQLKEFADGLGLTFPIVYDEGAAGQKYRVAGLPTTFFIDKDGYIRAKVAGAMTETAMRRYMEETSKGGR